MKYSEAEKQIKALSSKYSVRLDKFHSEFNVDYKGLEVAYVSIINQYSVGVLFEKYFKTLPICDELYMIMAELAMTPLDKRVEEKKHYVKIYDGELGYLNIGPRTGMMSVNNKYGLGGYKNKFTDKEINELKQRDDIPLDWNKVKFEEIEDE